MNANPFQIHPDVVIQLQNQAAVALAASRRPLMEQASAVPLTSPSRQRADRVLLLAALQAQSGRFDHARGERLLECLQEVRASVLAPERAITENFAQAQYEATQQRAFNVGVAIYLAHLLAATAVTVADADDYSLRWHTLLVRAHTHLLKVALHEATSPDGRAVTTLPELFFRETDPMPRAKQLTQMEDRYEVLPAHPENRFRFVLAPLLLIAIGPDGRRRDIDLAGLITEPDEFPCGNQGPLLMDSSNTPTVTYTDRRGRAHELVYNPVALRYENLAPRSSMN